VLSQDKGRGVDAECLEGATEVQLDKELPEEKVDPPDDMFRSRDIRYKNIVCESGPTCIVKKCARDGRGDSCGKHYCPRVKIRDKWTLLVNGEQKGHMKGHQTASHLTSVVGYANAYTP